MCYRGEKGLKALWFELIYKIKLRHLLYVILWLVALLGLFQVTVTHLYWLR